MLHVQSGSRRWRAAAVVCAVVAVAACDDDPVGSIGVGECTSVRQSLAELEQGMASGKARVRVNIVSRASVEGNSRDFVALQSVNLYQGEDCTGIANATQTALATVENDVGVMVAEAVVEPGQITHLELNPATSGTARRLQTVKLALPSPVTVEGGTRNEFFVALDPVQGSRDLAPRFIAAGPVALDASTVLVFEPTRGSAVAVPGSFTLDLPVNGMSAAGVYGVVEHKLGGLSSMLSISPGGDLAKVGRITFPIDRTRIPTGMGVGDYGGYVGNQLGLMEVDGNTATMTMASLGDIRMASSVPSADLPDGQRIRTPDSGPASAKAAGEMGMLVNNACAQQLATNRAYYFDMLSRNGGVKINDCETRFPYVHIIMVNLHHGSLASYPYIRIPSQRYAGHEYLLKTISEHASSIGAFAAVNGFTWNGDEGTGTGQYGIPIGNVRIDNQTASPNFTGAEAIIGFTASSSTGGTGWGFFDKPAGNTINWGSYGYNAVPSTTSIIKGGACSRAPGGENSRWSAIGVGNGALVMVSSVSGYTTDAYELCGVFEGLNVLGGAIRLDGGPSAAIYWQGSGTTGVLNPLTGTYSWKYGSLRRIPYVVAGDW